MPQAELETIAADALRRPGLRHAFFTRRGGVSTGPYASLNVGTTSGDQPGNIAENMARVASALDVASDHLVTLHQTHSAVAHTVTGPTAERPAADGLVTTARGVALGIRTADCAPVLFADPQAGVIGAAHAGWRGAIGGVLEATLAAMAAAGADPSRTLAAIGPTIAQASYEVGADVVDAARQGTPEGIDLAPLMRPAERDGRMMFDLPGYVAARLAHAGVTTVEDVRRDTYADEARFFSHRRRTHRGEAAQGSLIAAIVLEA
ncbi:peptidoglycan editing factor PgeF [Acuticoccus sp.]|uniref:peptidoglycan editing factor PgeF n=1 Tax=Acuticoccus sp. TaxID=1904378 RepID=UPI003B5262B2